MWRHLLLPLLLLHVCLLSTRADDNKCDVTGDVVVCQCDPTTLNISSIPTDLPATITSLKIKDCNLGSITEKVNYPALTDLDLSGGRIATIIDKAFELLTQLTKLGLEHNSLDGTAIKKEIFTGLTVLEELDLSNNLVVEFAQEKCFSADQMPALKSLNLAENKLTKLESKHFDGLSALDTLDLSSNGDLDVDFSGAGETFKALKTLDLSGTKLGSLKKQHLTGMVALETLTVTGSNVQTVDDDAFDDASTLKTIILKQNGLTPTLSVAFKKLQTLTKLDVSENKLYWIDEDAMIYWDSLVTLTVTGNQWECSCRNAWLINQQVVNDSIPKDQQDDFKCSFPSDAKDDSIFGEKAKGLFETDCPCLPPTSTTPSTPTSTGEPPLTTSTEKPAKSSGSSSAHDTGVGFAIGLVIGLLLALVAFVIWCRYTRRQSGRASYTHHVNS